jgi:uncharacterized membrane protein
MNPDLKNSIAIGSVGLSYSLLALPLIMKKIKPNRWYGFRVKKTLSNPEIWYKANQIAGKNMLLAGLTILAATISTYFIRLNSASFPSEVINIVVFISAALASTVSSFRALKKL